MEICEMAFEDCIKIAEIEAKCFSEPWSYNSFTAELKNNSAKYFVAKINGDIAGYIGVRNIIDEGEITMVAVEETHRGKNIASLLFEKLIDYEKMIGTRRINLEVRESNLKALSLYKKHGFIINGLRKNYYSKPVENAVLMSLEL